MASLFVDRTGAGSATNDVVIGLNVGGKLFYTNRSTLTNGSPYFAGTFGGSFDAGPSRIDENGWKVYFVDADPAVFEHILNYLRDGVANWPSKAENSILRDRIRALADYYGIHEIAAALTPALPIIKFEPTESGKGVLYWLGTKKGTAEYQNPYKIGAVSFSGSCLERAEKEASEGAKDPETYGQFLQYQPLCGKESDFEVGWLEMQRSKSFCRYQTRADIMWCEDGHTRRDLVLDLKNVVVKPSHYSLRYSDCRGMSDWNFQASNDGESWVTLHRARNDSSIAKPSNNKVEKIKRAIDIQEWNDGTAAQRRSIMTSIIDEDLRQTWKAASLSFHRYFRIVGVTPQPKPQDDIIMTNERCMHAVGFELFGEAKDI